MSKYLEESGLQYFWNKIKNVFVAKETGKGLSTNDYTTEEKNKLSGIATGAEVNVQSDWNQTNTTADDYIKNKPDLALKVNEPDSEGTSGQVLTTDGNGGRSWTTVSSGGGSTKTASIDLTDIALTWSGSYTTGTWMLIYNGETGNNGGALFRGINQANTAAWVKGGASGSWGISVTGSAGSVAWGNVSGKPTTFAPSSHTHDDRYYTESEINTALNGWLSVGSVDISFEGNKTNQTKSVSCAVSGKTPVCIAGFKGDTQYINVESVYLSGTTVYAHASITRSSAVTFTVYVLYRTNR